MGLELHPQKTKVVCCKDADRTGSHEHEKFTFLGCEFRPRLAKNRHGKHFVSFLPAVSPEAMKAMGAEIRSWHWAKRSDKALGDHLVRWACRKYHKRLRNRGRRDGTSGRGRQAVSRPIHTLAARRAS